jgi:hypothetical protein
MSRPQARPRGRLGRARRGLRAGLTTEVRPGHSQEFAKPGIDDAGGRSVLRISRQLKVIVSFQILDSVFCTQTVLQYLA